MGGEQDSMNLVNLQHPVEKFPGGVNGQRIGRVIEECLEGKVHILCQCGFDDQFLVGNVLIDERREPGRERPPRSMGELPRG